MLERSSFGLATARSEAGDLGGRKPPTVDTMQDRARWGLHPPTPAGGLWPPDPRFPLGLRASLRLSEAL